MFEYRRAQAYRDQLRQAALIAMIAVGPGFIAVLLAVGKSVGLIDG